MSNPGRRDFLKNSMAVALAPAVKDALRVPVEPLTRLGGLDSAARAVDELLPEPLLERADLQADGRLRDPEPLGGL